MAPTVDRAPPPRFKHDCDACVFLGGYEAQARWGGYCDLYCCPRCDGGTVLARFSSQGPDYRSGPASFYVAERRHRVSNMDGSPADMTGYPLHEAFDRAVERGLLSASGRLP